MAPPITCASATVYVDPQDPQHRKQLRADLALEGGGVKGIGLAGAVLALDEAGYSFARVAGTSAGAIAASLVAAISKAGQPMPALYSYLKGRISPTLCRRASSTTWSITWAEPSRRPTTWRSPSSPTGLSCKPAPNWRSGCSRSSPALG